MNQVIALLNDFDGILQKNKYKGGAFSREQATYEAMTEMEKFAALQTYLKKFAETFDITDVGQLFNAAYTQLLLDHIQTYGLILREPELMSSLKLYRWMLDIVDILKINTPKAYQDRYSEIVAALNRS